MRENNVRRILPRHTFLPLVTLVPLSLLSLFYTFSAPLSLSFSLKTKPFLFFFFLPKRVYYTLLQKRTGGQCTRVPSVSDGTYTTKSGESREPREIFDNF